MDQYKRKCCLCGKVRESKYFDGTLHYCATCLSEQGIKCDNCGNYFPDTAVIWLDDEANDKIAVCPECYYKSHSNN